MQRDRIVFRPCLRDGPLGPLPGLAVLPADERDSAVDPVLRSRCVIDVVCTVLWCHSHGRLLPASEQYRGSSAEGCVPSCDVLHRAVPRISSVPDAVQPGIPNSFPYDDKYKPLFPRRADFHGCNHLWSHASCGINYDLRRRICNGRGEELVLLDIGDNFVVLVFGSFYSSERNVLLGTMDRLPYSHQGALVVFSTAAPREY